MIELLKACDRAEKTCAQAQRDDEAIIQKQGELLVASQQALTAEREAHQGIMQSKTTWFVLGALFTGLTVFLVSPRR